MHEQGSERQSAAVWKMILTDAHFWIPAVVLLVGLLVLQWIR